jgi:hypothetical protein
VPAIAAAVGFGAARHTSGAVSPGRSPRSNPSSTPSASWPAIATSSAIRSIASRRSWKKVQPRMSAWVTAAMATPQGEANASPVPSQSEMLGLSG